MAEFIYKAKKGPKEIVEGVVTAENQEAAVEKLAQMGYIPIRVTPQEKKSSGKAQHISSKPSASIRQFSFFNRVRAKDLTVFTEQLSSLIKSKVLLLEALNILSEQTENLCLKKILFSVCSEVKDGATLSESLSKYPRIFPALYINMIASGEQGGVLEETLARLSDFRNREEEIKTKVTSALAYPVFIVVVGIMTVFVLLGFVIPRLTDLFNEMGQVLPLATRVLISVSDIVKNYWLAVLIVVLIAVNIFKRSGIAKKEKAGWDRFKLKLPLAGNFIKKSAWARLSRTLAALLDNGIPLLQAIKITIPTLDNEVFKLELEKVKDAVTDGISLEQSMKNSPYFSSFMISMLAVGEKGGNLERALQEVANFYEREIDKTTKVITSLIEPVIILIMGLVVGFIVLAMLLPIFQMNMQI